MGTVVRRNERSWAIVIISEIRQMLDRMNLKIKSIGGESTLSVDKQSMFPDVLLYADEAQIRILQGWELKMPDVSITDEALIRDAQRKAEALGLNSFVIWNFTYGKLYIRNGDGFFAEARAWDGTEHIRSREDVFRFKEEWLPVLEDIVLTVNEFLATGSIHTSFLASTVSDGLMTEVIQRNKEISRQYLMSAAAKDMVMERRLNLWWRTFRDEYDMDEKDLYAAYAKTILLSWVNRILFANVIKRYHNCAYRIDEITPEITPARGNEIIDQIVEEGDFYSIFHGAEYSERIPEDTWIDIALYNQFLAAGRIETIDQKELQGILEKTVHTAKREIRGQFATPAPLAELLCQITVRDWTKPCGDLCAGTGTIAKALLQNKSLRLASIIDAYESTWISDKYAYPLQIANIALTDIRTLNLPLNLFQADVFAVDSGMKVTIKSPVDGSALQKEIPKFSAILSNLPFVEYNKVAADELDYINRYRQKIKEATGITFTSGKTDLYNYLPFKLYELLEEGGRLGIIISNSWLGTDVGLKFFRALQYYYEIQAVVISNSGRWFRNADVIGTMVVLQKKEISSPDPSLEIPFWLLNREIREMTDEEQSSFIDSVVLREEADSAIAAMRVYSISEIEKITAKGVVLNALFHDVAWIEQLGQCLAPVGKYLTVKRGERRGWNDLFYPGEDCGIEEEYIRPVLKKPAKLQSYMAQPDIQAFCCHKSKEELKEAGHFGALRWIEKFETIKNNTGKPLPEALRRPGFYWYEMDEIAKADFVTAINPDKRLFVARFSESTFVDQRFTRMLLKDSDISPELLHALLNSLYGMFAMEAIGFGRGLGVLDASSTKLKRMYMIDPAVISAEDAQEIVRLFLKIRVRKVKNVEEELQDPDREAFDRKVLESVGHGELYEPIKMSLLSLQDTRHALY